MCMRKWNSRNRRIERPSEDWEDLLQKYAPLAMRNMYVSPLIRMVLDAKWYVVGIQYTLV